MAKRSSRLPDPHDSKRNNVRNLFALPWRIPILFLPDESTLCPDAPAPCVQGMEIHRTFHSSIIFGTVPQLRHLYLCNAAPSLFAIPWETLTVFHGEESSPRDCARVLQLAPSLVDCTFFGNAHETTLDLDPATTIISHPNLKSFQFCSGLNAFFQHLTFPALETLIVEDDVDAVMLQFLSRSASSLLKLSSTAISVDSLSGTAALTDLNMCSLSSKYLAEFFPLLDRAKNPHFLPRLLVLELHGSPFVNMILVDALSSRSANPAAERQAASLEDPVGLALAELAQNGMEISLGADKDNMAYSSDDSIYEYDLGLSSPDYLW
ncbi:hypothetical protein DFH08DRAFT_1071629 [Mycena albidolilacea]|uniref:Uncharacterized protein n=1 Tax=Mycena albidolilacea TaxID=1033008 RepID=A0AAD7AW15_9AGAR|nr:hypothetical protein DFH08DRAFT_1071629 [Mycena albidolilacea]